MDLSQIKKKLNSLQQNNGKDQQKEKKQNFWKPPIGESLIRVVPSKYNKENPFTELFFYYGIGKKTIISPKNFGEKDPIADFVKQLRNTSDKENWKLAKKLEAKMRVFIPVIVRGHEDEGVKLWQFGKEVYMNFLNLADNEEIGDFTDVNEGRDIKVNTLGPDTTKTDYNKSSITPKIKTSPLSTDKDQIEKWLEEQPDPKEIYQKFSFDEIKTMLQEWLNPEGGEEGEEEDEEVQADKPKAINGSKDKFEKLFKD